MIPILFLLAVASAAAAFTLGVSVEANNIVQHSPPFAEANSAWGKQVGDLNEGLAATCVGGIVFLLTAVPFLRGKRS